MIEVSAAPGHAASRMAKSIKASAALRPAAPVDTSYAALKVMRSMLRPSSMMLRRVTGVPGAGGARE
ncbi:hypothetical protein ACEWX3_07380 [Mycobacterium sp. G7A2]|uniref:hypothetical protein n=1 Tax=Mycobacterium sp. G7A2 TaxID=3317307 RepID=UPI0035A90037